MANPSPWINRFPGAQHGWARLDAPAGTQLVDTAVQAMSAFMIDGRFANDCGFFPAAQACDDLLADTRKNVAALLGGKSEEIIFNTSTSANLFNITRSFATQWKSGDLIVCSELDHDANVAPWLHAARDAGATVEFARVNPETTRIDHEYLERLLARQPKWLAMSAASNATGTAPDLATIIPMAKSYGVRVLIDAVAYAPHRHVDVAALGCDALATSPYKWYGPHSGALWLKQDIMEEIPAYQIRPGHNHGPERFEYGTPAYEELAGINAAAQFLLEEGHAAIRSHEEQLLQKLIDGLLAIPGLRLYGEPTVGDERTPVVVFTLAGKHPDEVCKVLADHKVASWSGDFYAMELIRRLGTSETGGFTRLGLAAYTSEEDIDRALEAVAVAAA